MKFGNFVGKSHLVFTDNEKKLFKSQLKSIVENNNIGLKFSCSATTDSKAFYVEFKTPRIWVGRAKDKRRIFFEAISFIFYKENGCLEIYKDKLKGWSKDNVTYDTKNAPPFQYTCYIGVRGSEIRYRGRNEESILVRPTFTYGTEFSDMATEIKECVADLLNNVCYNRTT